MTNENTEPLTQSTLHISKTLIDVSEQEDSKDDLYDLFNDIDGEGVTSGVLNNDLDQEINSALLSFKEFNSEPKNTTNHEINSYSSSNVGEFSPFDSPCSSSSVSSGEDYANFDSKHQVKVNTSTISSLKQSMTNTSRLNGLFTTLKVTYLKLCKEFNYLLHKFNENEKVKFELINENNELRKLLRETIRDKEVERRDFKRELESMKREYTKNLLDLQKDIQTHKSHEKEVRTKKRKVIS